MEIKGKIIKAGPIETRDRRDGSGQYTMFDVQIQIGTYKRERANYADHTFEVVTEPDTINHIFFHDNARTASDKFRVGDLVTIQMHHVINKFGRTEVVVDSMMLANGPFDFAEKNTNELPF